VAWQCSWPKHYRKSPRDIAQALVAALAVSALVEKVEMAGAGFINVFITVVCQTGSSQSRATKR